MPSTNERNAAVRALVEGDVIAGKPSNAQLLNIADHVLKAAEEQRAADAENPLMLALHLWQTNRADIDELLAAVGGVAGLFKLRGAILHLIKAATAHPDPAAALKSMAQAAPVGR